MGVEAIAYFGLSTPTVYCTGRTCSVACRGM